MSLQIIHQNTNPNSFITSTFEDNASEDTLKLQFIGIYEFDKPKVHPDVSKYFANLSIEGNTATFHYQGPTTAAYSLKWGTVQYESPEDGKSPGFAPSGSNRTTLTIGADSGKVIWKDFLILLGRVIRWLRSWFG